MGLVEEVAGKRAEILTDSYPMSIGELINLYRDNEIHLQPEFQRYFRWDEWQKSRLIESILLGIPIPSIFVSQRDDGTWDVIDGLQRLSTIFEFVGILVGPDEKLRTPQVLQATEYLPSLQGAVWEASAERPNGIGRDHQLLIKRAKIELTIIKRESDASSKYELFQRLTQKVPRGRHIDA